MLGAHMESPRPAPVYVVRNTFVEIVDETNGEQPVEEPSVPPFRRRRGSSFFRSSSEPLTSGGRGRGRECCEEKPFDAISTEDEDEGSDVGLSTPEMSPTNSRVPSPAPGSRSPMYVSQLPQLEQHSPHQNILAAAMHAGFNAGIWTAMSQPSTLPQFCPQGANVRQMPQSFEALKPSLQLPQAGQVRHLVRESSPFEDHSSNSSDAGTVACGAKPAHLIWCDHRAFKETSDALKEQLESSAGVTAKTHKTAENCIRLFRKKQRAQGRPPCVILVSWANAPALLQYLAEANHVTAKVVVLCDTRSCRKNESADQLAAQFPFIYDIATTWEAAVDSARKAVAAFH